MIKRIYILNYVFCILEKNSGLYLEPSRQSEVIIVGSCETSTTSETEKKNLRTMKRIKTFRSTIEIVALTMLVTEKSLVNSIPLWQ